MYSLRAYGSMIADRIRVDAYAEALRRTVRQESIVAEIGTGPGVFAVLACQLGAERVFAIEPAEIIQLAREVPAAFRAPHPGYRGRAAPLSCPRRDHDPAKGHPLGGDRGSSKTLLRSRGSLGSESFWSKPESSAAARGEQRAKSAGEPCPAFDWA